MAEAKKPRERTTARGDATRNQILDASEVLFGSNGYLGTSLRDIAEQAGVRMGLVHYHFGNKHEILDAALERKLGLLRETIAASFAQADEKAAGELDLEAMVTAFILPFLHAVSTDEDPLRSYIIMTSHLMSSYRLPELRPILGKLSSISEILVDRLKRHRPEIGEKNLLAGVYLIEAALIFMVQDSGFLDDLSQNHHSVGRLEDIAQPALRFFASGLESLQNPS
ncbi:TetR/AcrR family transcriptional regulator [Novosphingobium sp. JCM 18896]|uniref:TetR/AcrR family transcriptional regulator n=1 Tax=Novosphingobium sp. JCM 18896 TaxID=2989731 RepID=UPI0022214054|nr:TetR/AcrR family transcriptional regulator [Novosphingobium sp. JCM 18896]MCW1427804.1 TetR/AcrR family transcriptional regulator [Novosphingobium sp. JCM 18896]